MNEDTDRAEAALTADEVCRVMGERVRELRLSLGLSLERLAEESGVSLGMLSKIENGQTSPSFSTMTTLTNTMGAPFTALFRGLDEEHDALVVPSGKGLLIDHKGGGTGRTYHDLGSLRGPIRELETVLITITKSDEVFPLFQHGGTEVLHVLQGAMEYGYGAKSYTLRAGDTMHIRGEVSHGPTAVLELPTQFLSIKTQMPPRDVV